MWVTNGAARMQRVACLDGLRGVLAVIVVLHHANLPFIERVDTNPVATFAVMLFFLISGYVLSSGWRGNFAVFLARRFIRLWPVFAVSLVAGYLLAWKPVNWLDFIWTPPHIGRDADVNLPTWSLTIEAWMMLAMPVIVWVTEPAARWRLSLYLMAILIATVVPPIIRYGILFSVPFVMGSILRTMSFRARLLELPVAQWLGKISYSLYLSHYLVMVVAWRLVGPLGGVAAIPLTFVVGWTVWYVIERPSIAMSRKVAWKRATNPVTQP